MNEHAGLMGRTVLDRYRVEEEIGHGASSVVFRALDLRYERMVALKVLRAELAGAVGSRRFLREIEVAARLQHPHILPLYDSGEVDGVPFYVMPYVEGRSLRDELERRGELPIEEAAVIAAEIGSALAYAHEHGVVHRDVKPENVLLTAGHAVVADFGIARALAHAGGETLTSAGIALGTPKYMAPEQFDNPEVDERCDVYAMGCVVYEMLAGEPPYVGSTPEILLARHATHPVPEAGAARADVPRELSAAVSRSLAKPPEARFATAAEFVDAIRPFATSGDEGEVRRRGLVATLALTAALAAALGVVLLTQRFGAESLDAQKIMVFPLEERNLPAELRGSGYDVALILGAAMEQTDPLRRVEGAPRLTREQRSAVGGLTVETLSEVSSSSRARYFLSGALLADVDSLRLTLRLNDVLGDSMVDRRSVAAPIGGEAPTVMALRALPELLPPLLEPGRAVDLTPLSDRDPAAIALFIQADRLYRTQRYEQALELYGRALERDGDFALASTKGAMAASWLSDGQAARRLSEHSVGRIELLPPAHRLFVRGLNAFWAGDADSAASLLQAVVDTAGEWAEAHAALGEVYYHLLPSDGPMGDSAARIAFDSARVLDPQLAEPFFHLVQIELREDRPDSAAALLRSMQEVTAGAAVPEELDFALQCVRDGVDAADWRGWVQQDSLGALAAATSLASRLAHPACAEAGFRAVWASQDPRSTFAYSAVLGLQSVLVSSGRFDEAAAVLDSAFAQGQPHAISLFIMNTVGGAPFERQAIVGDQFARGLFGDEYESVAQPFTAYVFGIWNAYRQNVTNTRRLYEKLGTLARDTEDPYHQALFGNLAAHLDLAEGDTASAVRRLRALRPRSPHTDMDFGMAQALPVERILLAKLLLQRGDFEQAERVAAGFDHPEPLIYVAFLRESLRIRLAAARALGRAGAVEAYQTRLDRLSVSPIPPP